MAGATERDNSRAVLLGLVDGKLHSFVRNNLTNVVVTVDDGADFSLAHDLRFLSDVYRSSFNKRQVLWNACDSMAGIAAKLRSDKKLRNELRVVMRHAAQ